MTWRDFPYKTFRPALQDCNGLENSAGHVQLRVLLRANYLDYRLGNYSRSTGSWRAAGGEAPFGYLGGCLWICLKTFNREGVWGCGGDSAAPLC